MLLMSSTNLSSHTGRHNFFTVQRGTPKYLKNYNIIPRLTLLMETFIHTIIHSLFFPPSPLTLFHFLGNFLTSWTLPFLGHFLFLWDLISFLWGPFNFILLQFVGLHPTVTIRLISGRACLGVSTIKSAALMFPPPRVNLLVPVATYNTCSAHN